ncbi:suppressor of fused domain protein [Zooshikella ganghwensis]|uniref:Suppressor of fused domain protein n=1 Tax=Zooshikella ganghwensis TaxID=202772 RepID=A0A4P9VFJ2_9GAMM|nr:suppressor of fused domain protein [Zooshikella ganghwensis]RDH41783.1 suppressor of fused domain protein [Zooshikella ganghwensis]
MELEEYKSSFNSEDAAPGWDAIDSVLKQVYAEQEPKHWGTIIKYMLGGPDPLDGISAYQSSAGNRDHLHFCSYGFTSLYYDEEAVGQEFSKFGFELTFRLLSKLPPDEEPIWVCNLMQNLARYVFESGKWFEEYHWIPAWYGLKTLDTFYGKNVT